MRTRRLGKSSLDVSEVGLGTSNFGGRLQDPAIIQQIVNTALDLGVNFFDTADIYGDGHPGSSEVVLGTALGARRPEVIIATKFGLQMPEGRGAQGRYVIAACEASLRRLNTDYIDLYQLHTPDPTTPIEETLRALEGLIAAGKVRYAGCSNQTARGIERAYLASQHEGVAAFVSAQDEYSLINRKAEDALIPTAHKCGMGLIPYYPLASGLLTGKYRQGGSGRLTQDGSLHSQFVSARSQQLIEELWQFAQENGRTLVELAMSWLLTQPTVTSVIAGAMTPQQLKENVFGAEWELTDEDLAEIDGITANELVA